MRYPGRGPGMLGPRYDRWGVDLAPPCRAPDAGRLVPELLQPRRPQRPRPRRRQGPEGVVGQQQLPRPRLPPARPRRPSSVSLAAARATARRCCDRLDALRRGLDAPTARRSTPGTSTASRRCELLLADAARAGSNPFDLTPGAGPRPRPATAARSGARASWSPGGWSRRACAWCRSTCAAGTRTRTPSATSRASCCRRSTAA